MHTVFVYGSLRKTFGNHRLIQESKYLGEHTTEPEYTMISYGGFPAVIKTGDTPIKGEVYEVDEPTFRSLDRLEGFPHFYDRQKIKTPYGWAWIYQQYDLDDRMTVVESGDWREWMEEE